MEPIVEKDKTEQRLEKLESMILSLANDKIKNGEKIGIFKRSLGFFLKIFSRDNLELILSIISLLISCTVAFYVITQ